MLATIFLSLACLAIFSAYTIRQMMHQLHMLQLNSYRNERYSLWLHRDFVKNFNFSPAIALISIVFISNELIFLGIWGSVYVVLFLSHKPLVQKKPLVITARIKRLMVIITSIFCLLPLGVYFLTNQFVLSFILLSLLLLLIPYTSLLANILAIPVEQSIANGFVKQAKKTIRSHHNLKVIGITGSYGKTSTKFILQQILATQYHTLMTPESYNTLMGVTRVINENLKPLHNLFIVEMGAKQKGDIKEISDLVRPEIGLITTIGEQHLETFKTLDNIKNTKAEIINDLPNHGIAVLNGDNQPSLALNNATSARIVYFAIDNPQADYQAKNIKILNNGLTTFDIRLPDEQVLSLESRLLGQHNIYNILSAVSIANELRVNHNKIKSAVRAIKPAPHRMNVKPTKAGITIIDNAFSTNPSAARSSVEVMAKIDGKQKIIITPGMIELGEIEYEENKKFGQNIPNGLDYVILVGHSRQTTAIQEGLDSVKFPSEQVYLAADLNDANRQLRAIAQTGDVVLYENDLPDNYL